MALTDQIKAWLNRKPHMPPPPPLPAPDAQLALGTLLVRVAKSDRAYLFEELEQIDRILAARNGVGPVEAAKMRAACEKLDTAFPDTPQFTDLISYAVPYEERKSIVAALWSVVLADGLEQEQETDLVHLIEQLLAVSTAEAKAAHDQAVQDHEAHHRAVAK